MSVGLVLSMLLLAANATPGVAAAYPSHREEEWWFVAWNIENKVWPITQGDGVTVAVLDTGVQADISELSGVVLPGKDFVTGSGDGRTDLDDESAGHGTAMAALIAAQGGRNRYAGVAPGSKILPVAVSYGSKPEAVIPGIRFAVDRGAKVINLSIFSPIACPAELQNSISYAIEHDVVVVAGAGNSADSGNPSGSPANCAGVLAVGAIDYRLKAWEKTQKQPYVSVAGPGLNIANVAKDGRFYPDGSGTSDAAALTSGAVALVRSKYPDMPAREVVQRIIASTRDAGPPGKDEQTGYGVVRPYQALVNKVPRNAPNPVYAAYDEWAEANGKVGDDQSGTSGQGSKVGGFKEFSSSPLALILVGVVVLGVVLLIAKMARRKPGTVQLPQVAWGPPGGPQVPQQYGPPQQFGPPSFGQPPAGGPGQAPAGWPQPPAAPPGPGPGAPNPAPPQSPYGASGEGRQ